MYGSLVNHIAGASASQEPKVNDGATILFWTDRQAGTVINVSPSGKSITIREDRAIRTDTRGMTDAQQYRYEPNDNGREWVFTLRRNGRWVLKGETMNGGLKCAIGVRNHYFDYSH